MNLIASVLHLDRAAIQALKITDPYGLHRVVYSLYPDVRSVESKSASVPSGILFADRGGDFSARRILLLADREPAGRIDGHYGQVESRPIPTDFLSHEFYRFQVIVNPTRRDHRSGNLVGIKGADAIAQWFAERAVQRWGFEPSLPQLQVDKIQVLRFQDKSHRTVTLAQATIQGQLRVIDREAFHHSFQKGIGRGRAFGCGLLQIVPLVASPFV